MRSLISLLWGSNDHDCLLWKYKCYDVPPPAKLRTPMFNYRKGDYQAMNDFFKETNWTHILCNDRIEANLDVFKQLVNDAIVRFVPTSTPKSPPWWTKVISDAIKAKNAAFCRYRRTKSCTEYANYKAKRY